MDWQIAGKLALRTLPAEQMGETRVLYGEDQYNPTMSS